MKTTLNFPDDIISEAKIRAVQEKTTLTELIVQGLKMRLRQGGVSAALPESEAAGGLVPGITWENIGKEGEGNGVYR